MKKLLIPALALMLAAPALADDEKKSGLKDGAFVGAFNVKDCTGPSKGKSLCYRCQYGNRPVVAIFTRKIDDNVASLIKDIDGQVGKNKEKKMKAFVVLLTDDPDAAETSLAKVAKKNGIKHVPLTVFDGISGPPSYKLKKDADVTVLMWNKSRVKSNHGFAAKEFNKKTVQTVSKETTKILD